jgi:hypothetical protein
MAIAFAEENPAQRHTLAGRTQSNLAQHGLDVMPWATGERGPVWSPSGVSHHLRNHRGTLWVHFFTPKKPAPHKGQRKAVAFETYTQLTSQMQLLGN